MESTTNDSAPNASIDEEENRAAAKHVSDDDHSTTNNTNPAIHDDDRLFIERLCELDPDKLLDLAKVDASLIEQLEGLSVGLRESLERVKEEKAAEEENTRRQERQRLVDGNACFECGKVKEGISPCLCFQEDGVNGNGIRVCNDCLEQDTIHLCSICLTTLCDADCGMRMCYECSKPCCTSCIDKENISGWKICDSCDEIFCPKCKVEAMFDGCGCAQQKD